MTNLRRGTTLARRRCRKSNGKPGTRNQPEVGKDGPASSKESPGGPVQPHYRSPSTR